MPSVPQEGGHRPALGFLLLEGNLAPREGLSHGRHRAQHTTSLLLLPSTKPLPSLGAGIFLFVVFNVEI